jgi:mono/diheme cytochrome c family protein
MKSSRNRVPRCQSAKVPRCEGANVPGVQSAGGTLHLGTFARLHSGTLAPWHLGTLILALLSTGACRQDMHNQPKYRSLRGSAFFTNGSSARPLVEGTIARGTLQDDSAFFTGKVNGADVKELPFAVDQAALDRGEERFNIYCTPCHDRTGNGRGMVVQRGYRQPPSFHIDRLRQVEDGHFFDVITNGFGAMPDYKAQISPRDRWNIVAYVRALQYSQHATPADVPGGDPTKVAPPAAREEKH